MKHITIVGSGAIGSALAGKFARHGFSIALWGRGRTRVDEVIIREDAQTTSVVSGDNRTSAAQMWVFCTKASDLRTALQEHAGHIRSGDVILLVANGYWLDEAQQWCAGLANGVTIFAGVTTYAVRHDDDQTYRLLNPATGHVTFGFLDVTCKTHEAAQCLIAVPGFIYTHDIRPIMRKKWVANCVVNSLAAAADLPRNVDVLTQPNFGALFAEVYHLSGRAWGNWLANSPEQLFSELVALITETGENLNSMVRDRRLRRPLELRYTIGMILNYPDEPAPILRAVLKQLTALPNDLS